MSSISSKALDNNYAVTRSYKEKVLDYLLYLGIFSGTSLIAGGIVHVLNDSIYNYILLIIGTIMAPLCMVLREVYINQNPVEGSIWHNFIISLTVSVSAGCFTGGINHIQEHFAFSLYLIISGFIMAFATTLLYRKKKITSTIIDFVIWLATFTGMSLVSGSIVHSANDWFSNYFLIVVGTFLTPLAIMIKEKFINKKKVRFGQDFILLTVLSFGVGCMTGGIIHIDINFNYSIALIAIGFALSFTAAMQKNDGTLADLRSR